MKKFILLLLILPLTLMARPEKKWLQIPTAGFFGSVVWTANSSDCAWTGNSDTYTSWGADDDCDNVARTIRGFYNKTDKDCTDGGGGDCDGAFPRIKFSYMPKGTYKFVMYGNLDKTATTGGACLYGVSDGTTNYLGGATYTGSAVEFSPSTVIITVNLDRSFNDVTWNFIYRTRASTGDSCLIVNDTVTADYFGIIVYYYPDYSDSRYIITK